MSVTSADLIVCNGKIATVGPADRLSHTQLFYLV